MNSDVFDILEVITSMDEIFDEVEVENEGYICPHCVVIKVFERIKQYSPGLSEEVEVVESCYEEGGHESLMVTGESFEDVLKVEGEQPPDSDNVVDINKNKKNNSNNSGGNDLN